MDEKICKYCGSPAFFSKKIKGYRSYCLECKNRHIKEQREKTMLEKYEVPNPSYLDSRKEVMERVNAIRREKFAKGELQVWAKGRTKETCEIIAQAAKKGSKTQKDRYASGVKVWNKGLTKETDSRLQGLSESLKESWVGREMTEAQKEVFKKFSEAGATRERTSEEFEKQRQTNLDRYGVPSYLSLVYPLGAEKQKEKYGSVFLGSKVWGENKDIYFDKMKQTNLKKYGTEYVLSNSEIIKRIINSKRKNNSFHSSSMESESVRLIQTKIKDVFVQYSDERYPFSCDIYLPKYDMFIELNYFWTHGFESFEGTEEQLIKLEEWKEKAKESRFFENAIYTWTDLDVRKRLVAKENDLNYKMFFHKEDFEEFVSTLEQEEISYPKRRLIYLNTKRDHSKKRFDNLLKSNKSYNSRAFYNDLILPFMWGIFYKKELELWEDEEIRNKLIQNRVKYLHKKEEDISDNEFLQGFSKSLIHKGFSSFSPFTIKRFIKDYNIKSIYDPCGGWGHRLLGAWEVDYWYNDFHSEKVDRAERMAVAYGEFNTGGEKYFSCEDASTFVPDREFNAVFTCPPYFDTEDYDFEGDSSSIFSNYEDWLNIWWRSVVENCKKVSDTFAFVVSEKYYKDMTSILEQSSYVHIRNHVVSENKKNHLSTSAKEVLTIWKLM